MSYSKFIFPVLLSILTLSCSDSNKTGNKEVSTPAAAPSSIGDGNLKIAYVNTDSLFEKYDLLKDLENQFIEEKLVMENQFRTEVERFEKDYRDAEAGAPSLSESELQILGMKLQQREQELMAKKQSMESQLATSEADKNDKLFDELKVFLDEYAKSNGYHMIYGYNGFGNVLYMDAQFDITNIVVDSLNRAYGKTLEGETASE